MHWGYKKIGAFDNPTNTTAPNQKKTNANERFSNYRRIKDKPPPSLFKCGRPVMKHFLADCGKFETFAPRVNPYYPKIFKYHKKHPKILYGS